MIIKKLLKNVQFEYDFDDNKLAIIVKKGSGILLIRRELFSLMRFGIRIAQKGKPRKYG